jgi:hypothetical protein
MITSDPLIGIFSDPYSFAMAMFMLSAFIILVFDPFNFVNYSIDVNGIHMKVSGRDNLIIPLDQIDDARLIYFFEFPPFARHYYRFSFNRVLVYRKSGIIRQVTISPRNPEKFLAQLQEFLAMQE